MKANQAFRSSEEAVSPVIGVILMVAITVILAVVVFALVSRLSNTNSTQNPKVNFSSADNGAGAGGFLTVLSVANQPQGGNIEWDQVAFTGSAGCTDLNTNAAIAAGESITCSNNGNWNLVYTPTGQAGVVIAQGNFPTA